MRYPLLVAAREYAENAKTKGFWIGLLMLPVILYAAITIQVFLQEKAIPVRHFVFVDQSGQFDAVVDRGLERHYQRKVLEELGKYVQKHGAGLPVDAEALERLPAGGAADLARKLEGGGDEELERLLEPDGLSRLLAGLRPLLRPDAPPFAAPRRPFVRVEPPAGVDPAAEPTALAEALKPYLLGEKKIRTDEGEKDLFAAVIVPSDIAGKVVRPGVPALPSAEGVRFWSMNLADEDLRSAIERSINEEVRRRAYLERGVDEATVRDIEGMRVPLASFDPKKEEGKEIVSQADVIRQWAPVGFVYLLWIAIFIVAQMLLQNTIEEKSNRIIEVLVSSVTPWELMAGKLVGIAAVGLTMMAAWLGSAVAILAWRAGPEAEFARLLLEVLRNDQILIPAFAVYFLLGYLFYSGIFLAVGSVCNTLKEAQNFMGPVQVVLMVPLFTMMFIPRDPNGTLATILSWIPLYTPFVMMNRAAADPPLRDLVGTLVMMAVSAAGMLWLSGRIFRIGILRTGQPPKLLELARWVRRA